MTTQADLAKYDVLLLIDKSGSMGEQDCPGGVSRWKYAQEATEALARKAAEFDNDGITVVPFNNTYQVYENVTPDKVHQVFTENEPNGGTNTALVLGYALDEYFAKKADGAKPRVILVITDGQPNDKQAVRDTIIKAANKLDEDGEIGISFIQVGKDVAARAFLQELDDNLQSEGAKFDIVDTKTMDEMESMALADVLIAALDD